MTMYQHGDTFMLRDLKRFTTDVPCNQEYQIILSPHANDAYTNVFLIVKTDLKVFVRDFFRDSRKERNITLHTVNFDNNTKHTVVKINKTNKAGLENVVEGNGVVSLFGRMTGKRPRCQLFIGMLPMVHDSTRCQLCEAEPGTCGFCGTETDVHITSMQQRSSSNTSKGTFLNITVIAYTNDCLYWEEDAELWAGYGCKVRGCS